MSRTNHASKGPGYEYWASRLHRHGETPGRYTKVATHKKERRVARHQLYRDQIRCELPAEPYGAQFLHDPDPETFLADWEAYEDDWGWMDDLCWDLTAARQEQLR